MQNQMKQNKPLKEINRWRVEKSWNAVVSWIRRTYELIKIDPWITALYLVDTCITNKALETIRLCTLRQLFWPHPPNVTASNLSSLFFFKWIFFFNFIYLFFSFSFSIFFFWVARGLYGSDKARSLLEQYKQWTRDDISRPCEETGFKENSKA